MINRGGREGGNRDTGCTFWLSFLSFPPFFPHVINVMGQLTERAAEGSMGIDIYLHELIVLMFCFLLSFFLYPKSELKKRKN